MKSYFLYFNYHYFYNKNFNVIFYYSPFFQQEVLSNKTFNNGTIFKMKFSEGCFTNFLFIYNLYNTMINFILRFLSIGLLFTLHQNNCPHWCFSTLMFFYIITQKITIIRDYILSLYEANILYSK